MNNQMLQAVLAFLAGTFFGSFFYTLSLRYSAGVFESHPIKGLISRSKCPACSEPISPIGLIPILGYFFLGGKCRSCRSRISWFYPIMEFIYGIIALITVQQLGFNLYSLNIYIIIALALSISIIDIKTYKIPNAMVIVFLIISTYPVLISGNLLDNVYGIILMFLFFLIVLLIFPGSFGGGDLKFASAIGFLLGLELAVVALEVSLISGALIGILYAVISGRGLKSKIAFGPFLSFGLFIALLWGQEIILLYYYWIY